jgi:hypothetical protein
VSACYEGSVILLLIVLCEAGFWVVLLGALSVRYVLRWRRVSTGLLLTVPLIDASLAAATLADLHRLHHAGPTHALAASYLAVTAVYGHRIVQRIDVRFAHRYAGVPLPPPGDPSIRRVLRAERQRLRRSMSAWLISTALELAGLLVVGGPVHGHWLLWCVAVWSSYVVFRYTQVVRRRPAHVGAHRASRFSAATPSQPLRQPLPAVRSQSWR